MAYTKYSLTPANNNAAPPDGAPEGMLPSAVNDTMRDMMAQIRDVGDGIRGGTYTMTAPVITGGSITGVALSGNTFTNPVITGGSINNTPIGGSTPATGTFTSLSDSGNLTFTGTGNRITGDFSNATASSQVAFQSSTTNGQTNIYAAPNGTSTTAAIRVANDSALANFSSLGMAVTNTTALIQAAQFGSGSFLPLAIQTGGSERLRIDTSGNVGIGTSSPSTKLEVASGLVAITDGTATQRYFIVQNSAGRMELGLFSGGEAYWGTTTNDPLTFYANNSEWMRITSTGNIGINTSSPAYRLDVNGVMRNASSADASPYTQQRIAVYNDGSNWGYFGYGVDALMRVVYSKTATDAPLLFGTSSATDNTGTFTEQMRIASSGGSLVLKGGIASPGGTGITFPATQSASSDANTLDDYEEGTWTPTLRFANATTGITYNERGGRYTKIGNVVTLNGYVNLSSKGSATGDATFTGIPFAADTITRSYTGNGQFDQNGNAVPVAIQILPYGNVIYNRYGNSNSFADVTNTNFTNTTVYFFSTTYIIA